jgi:hypothetical protein
MGRDDVYPVRTSKVCCLLHYVIAYLLHLVGSLYNIVLWCTETQNIKDLKSCLSFCRVCCKSINLTEKRSGCDRRWHLNDTINETNRIFQNQSRIRNWWQFGYICHITFQGTMTHVVDFTVVHKLLLFVDWLANGDQLRQQSFSPLSRHRWRCAIQF